MGIFYEMNSTTGALNLCVMLKKQSPTIMSNVFSGFSTRFRTVAEVKSSLQDSFEKLSTTLSTDHISFLDRLVVLRFE